MNIVDNQFLGIIFGLIAMAGLGTGTILSVFPAREIGSRRTVFYRNFFTSLCLFIALVLSSELSIFEVRIDALWVLITFFAISLVGYVPLRFFVKALGLAGSSEEKRIGIISLVGESSIVFCLFFSVLLFGDSFEIKKILPIFLIFSGIFLNLADLKNLKLEVFLTTSGVKYAMVSCVLWGFLYSILRVPIEKLGPIFTALILEAGIMFYAYLDILLCEQEEQKAQMTKRDFKFLFLMGVVGAVASLALALGIKFYDTSIVYSISCSSPLVTILISYFVFKEKQSNQQWFSVLLFVSGIILIFNL